MKKYRDLYHRLTAHVTVPADQCESTGCWEHDGQLNREGGYPRINVRQGGKVKHLFAHRAMFSIAHGEIADGHEVDHVCHNHRCINPDHLQLLPIPDNRAKNQWAIRG
jgi:hypothetical protein